MEIQLAARRVAEENQSLKNLLRAKGVNEEEISAHLLTTTSSVSLHPAAQMLARRKPCFQEWDRLYNVSSISPKGTQSSISRRRPGLERAENHKTNTSRSASLLTWNPPEEQIPELGLLATSSTLTRRSSTESYGSEQGQQVAAMESAKDERSIPGTTTSCNLAITIIAGTNREISESQARLDLGCDLPTDCNVQNSALLELLDRYSAPLVY